MEILVLILIIWVIVRRAKLAQQRQGTRPNVPRQQNRPQQARPAQGYRMPQQARPAQGYQTQQARPAQGYRMPQQARPAQGYQMPQQAYQAAQPTYARPQQNGGQAYGARQNSKGAQQRGVGQRLAQWRGQQSQGGGRTSQQTRPHQAQSNDILTRAAANVRENEQDELERQMLDGAQTLVNAIDIEGTSELMREIDDLMIMGYQADLSFERDFVAEGVEMLNSYELPAEI